MSLNCFHNMLTPSLFSDEAFTALNRKTDECEKSVRTSIDFILNISQVFDAYLANSEKLLYEHHSQLDTR